MKLDRNGADKTCQVCCAETLTKQEKRGHPRRAQLTEFAWIDVLGAAGLIYFSVNEGREAFEKAADADHLCGCEDDCEVKGKEGE